MTVSLKVCLIPTESIILRPLGRKPSSGWRVQGLPSSMIPVIFCGVRVWRFYPRSVYGSSRGFFLRKKPLDKPYFSCRISCAESNSKKHSSKVTSFENPKTEKADTKNLKKPLTMQKTAKNDGFLCFDGSLGWI